MKSSKELREFTDRFIDLNREDGVQLLKRLIQQKSIQGEEAGAQSVIIDYLQKLPVTIDVWDISKDRISESQYFLSERSNFDGCPNVAARLVGTGGGKSILLNGHIDVVPEGEIEKWTLDPYAGIIRDGKMYGRGTTDMKGGSVSLLMAVNAIIQSGIQLKGDVIFQSVIEEESGGAGSLSASLRGYRADAAIIPEPTGMKLFIKQQGSMWFRIRVKGLSAHGGTRYEGVSAMEKAMIIQKAILQLEKSRNLLIKDSLYKHIPITLPINLGKISGGTWPSTVPDLVIMEGRMGVGPEEKLADARSALTSCLKEVCETDEWLVSHPVELEFFGAQWVPNSVDIQHPFVKLVESKYKKIFDKELVVEASPWGTDAGILNAVGNIPTLVIGPGETRLAHFPDEYIDLNQMLLAARYFAAIIMDWCGVAKTA